MAYHPINLAIRFVLELVALYSAGEWAWKSFNNPVSWGSAILLPVILAAIWAIFNVRGDKSRSGKTVVPVPGIVRLILELSFFGIAGWFLYSCRHIDFSKIFLIVVFVHYLVSFERIKWLLKK